MSIPGRLGITWSLDNNTNAGNFGVELALQCIHFGVEPILMQRIDTKSLQPHIRHRLQPYIKSSEDHMLAVRDDLRVDYPVLSLVNLATSGNKSNSNLYIDSPLRAAIIVHLDHDAPPVAASLQKSADLVVAGSLHLTQQLRDKGVRNVIRLPAPLPATFLSKDIRFAPPASKSITVLTNANGTSTELQILHDAVAILTAEKHCVHVQTLPATHLLTPEDFQTGHLAFFTATAGDDYFNPAVCALAAGIPCCVVAERGHLDLLGKHLYMAPAQPHLLADLILRSKKRNRQSNSRALAARKFVQTRSSSLYIGKLLDVIGDALAGKLEFHPWEDLHALGNKHYLAGDRATADSVYSRILRHQPHHLNVLGDRGLVRRRLNKFEEAETDFRQILAVDPQNFMAMHGLGNVMLDQNRIGEAIAWFSAALAIQQSPALHWDMSYALLKQGEYARAWPHFEHRHVALRLRHPSTATARWDGQPVSNRTTLLILDEQGIGDTLQFLRFLKHIPREPGSRLIFAGKQEVLVLIKRLHPWIDVFNWDTSLPSYDCWVGLMSLPARLKIDSPAQLPPAPDCSALEPDRLNYWHRRIYADAADRRPVIGLCWRGNPDFGADAQRSPGLAHLLPVLELAEFRFISLQVGMGRREIHELGVSAKLDDVGGEIEARGSSVIDTIAAIANCDFVLSSCTSVVHMAGMTATPVAVMLSHNPDWRWMLNTNKSPWYTHVTLLRQQSPGDWPGVVQEAITLLGQTGSKISEQKACE